MDKKADKSKFKLKQQAYVAQEQLVTQKQNQIDDLTRNLNEIKRDLDRKDDDIRSLKQTNENLKNKFDDAIKQLEEKESVIRFLNQDINKQKAEQMRRPILGGTTSDIRGEIIQGNLMTSTDSFTKPTNFNFTSGGGNNFQSNVGYREFGGTVNTGNMSNAMSNNEFIMPMTNLAGYSEGARDLDNKYYKTIDSSILMPL
jgi:hypothetical protein